jgi:acetyl esterase/lipase
LLAIQPGEPSVLWPAGPPGGANVTVAETIVERDNEWGLRDRAVRGVRRPTLTPFRAPQPARGTLLLIPGGGYKHVVVDKEGVETAQWFAQRGFDAHVLLYRLPYDGWDAGPDAPLQDAQRAVRVLRAQARVAGRDPQRVAVLGFSAGGHLAARLATRHGIESYAALDGADRESARPALAALAYPVIDLQGTDVHAGSREHLLGASPSPQRLREYSAQHAVGPDTPPTFLLHANDDVSVPASNSLLMLAALRAADVPTELHLFAEGGHGFGLRGIAGKPVAAWPELLLAWLERQWPGSPGGLT